MCLQVFSEAWRFSQGDSPRQLSEHIVGYVMRYLLAGKCYLLIVFTPLQFLG